MEWGCGFRRGQHCHVTAMSKFTLEVRVIRVKAPSRSSTARPQENVFEEKASQWPGWDFFNAAICSGLAVP